MSDQELPGTHWSAEVLDRCEHGRHSIDSCFDCPGGHSTGNLWPGQVAANPDGVRTVEGRIEVRIGTAHRGEPIWVVVRDTPREAHRG